MSTIKTLLQDAENAGFLSSEDTMDLIRTITSSKPNKAKAVNRLVLANLKWIYSKVKCYRKLVDYEDLVMAGVTGFLDALDEITVEKIEAIANKYEYDYVQSLMAYATGFIRKETYLEIASYSNYELTEYRQKQISKVRKEWNNVESLFGDDLTYEEKLEEVSIRTGLSITKIKTALDYSTSNISLYTKINESNDEDAVFTFEDTLKTKFEDEIFNNYMIKDVNLALDYLSDTQRDVVCEFVGWGNIPESTVTKIAENHNKTRQWVYNTLNTSFEILRNCPLDLDAYYYNIG